MSQDEWLIRTAQNLISGPFTKQEVIDKVLTGELYLQDEVCSANEYWFYLHETEEVTKRLGISVPRMPQSADGERTNTETQTQTTVDQEATDPDLPKIATPVEDSILRYPEQAPEDLEGPMSHEHRPHLGGLVERAALLQWIAWILVLAIFLVVITVMKKIGK